jgi:hypothetical protein
MYLFVSWRRKGGSSGTYCKKRVMTGPKTCRPEVTATTFWWGCGRLLGSMKDLAIHAGGEVDIKYSDNDIEIGIDQGIKSTDRQPKYQIDHMTYFL